jgi:3-oxoacyl-[acyl-carrier protein] reductase
MGYDALTAAFMRRILTNHFGRPEELGSLVACLCSQDAGYITGRHIVVDGGYRQICH